MIVSWCKLQAKSIWDQIYLLSWSCWFSLSLWFCSSSWSSGPFFLLVFFIPTPSSWVEDRSTPYTFVCSMRHVHVYVQRHACIRVHPLSPSQGFLLIFIDFNTKCILFFADVCDSDSVWCWMPRIVAANAVANGNRKQAERQLGVQHAQVAVTFEMYLYLARNDKCGLPGGLICCGQAISSTVDVGRCRSILETGHSQRAACVGFCSRYINRDRAPACHFRFAWIHRSNYINGNRMHPPRFLVGYFFDPGLLFFDGFSELLMIRLFWSRLNMTCLWQLRQADKMLCTTIHTKYTLRFSFSQMPCTATNLPRRSSVELFSVASCLCTHE